MNLLELLRMEWPSIALACTIALLSGPLFGLTHDLYKHLLSPWVGRLLHRLRGR